MDAMDFFHTEFENLKGNENPKIKKMISSYARYKNIDLCHVPSIDLHSTEVNTNSYFSSNQNKNALLQYVFLDNKNFSYSLLTGFSQLGKVLQTNAGGTINANYLRFPLIAQLAIAGTPINDITFYHYTMGIAYYYAVPFAVENDTKLDNHSGVSFRLGLDFKLLSKTYGFLNFNTFYDAGKNVDYSFFENEIEIGLKVALFKNKTTN